MNNFDQTTGMYTNVRDVGITGLWDGRTYRVTLRDQQGAIIRAADGELEQQDLSKTAANREAKRLAKAYGVKVRVY